MVRWAAAVAILPPSSSWQQKTQRLGREASSPGTMASSRTLAAGVRCSRNALMSRVLEPGTRVKVSELERGLQPQASPGCWCKGGRGGRGRRLGQGESVLPVYTGDIGSGESSRPYLGSGVQNSENGTGVLVTDEETMYQNAAVLLAV